MQKREEDTLRSTAFFQNKAEVPMKISYIRIQNFKSIRDMEIKDVENALILVGKNNTGKTVVIDAIRVVTGDYIIKKANYDDPNKNISIELRLEFDEHDMQLLHEKGIVSRYKNYEQWEMDFKKKLPSFQDGEISFTYIVTPQGAVRYEDGVHKNNKHIVSVLPKIYHIDQQRNLEAIQNEVFNFYDESAIRDVQENLCIYDEMKKCCRCFQCIPAIHKKTPEQLTVQESARLLEYKLFNVNINAFAEKLNHHFHQNGSPSQDIRFEVEFHPDRMFEVDTMVYNRERKTIGEMNTLSEGIRSIYALSLLEAYIEEDNKIPCIIMIEDPEIYLHPQLQKEASEVLYRLSKKNQVIFSTHSPNMIFNFSSKQIRQVVLDENYYTAVKEETDVDEILDDLGYTANDLMNVNFVFIVEGKQDKERLPLLLQKYYSEIYDENGKPLRISIIQTNSCTNIKTYANLKYMNQLYLKDQFLMIRDSDGKNPNYLRRQLCGFYAQRAKEDVGNLPRVTPKNVLILKYYSFENYFLDPKVMAKIGVIKNEEEFYNILYTKFKDYLYKLGSVRRMIKTMNVRINSKQDLKNNMEMIKTYVRGHNLFDIFYGRYHNSAEIEILKEYIDAAPRENFKDILDAIDAFVYFENRKKE